MTRNFHNWWTTTPFVSGSCSINTTTITSTISIAPVNNLFNSSCSSEEWRLLRDAGRHAPTFIRAPAGLSAPCLRYRPPFLSFLSFLLCHFSFVSFVYFLLSIFSLSPDSLTHCVADTLSHCLAMTLLSGCVIVSHCHSLTISGCQGSADVLQWSWAAGHGVRINREQMPRGQDLGSDSVESRNHGRRKSIRSTDSFRGAIPRFVQLSLDVFCCLSP